MEYSFAQSGTHFLTFNFFESDNEWNMIWKFDDDSHDRAHREKHCKYPSSRVARPPHVFRDFALSLLAEILR